MDFDSTAGTSAAVNSVITVLPETTYFLCSSFRRLFTDFTPPDLPALCLKASLGFVDA
jgi:hypothetical protein